MDLPHRLGRQVVPHAFYSHQHGMRNATCRVLTADKGNQRIGMPVNHKGRALDAPQQGSACAVGHHGDGLSQCAVRLLAAAVGLHDLLAQLRAD